MLKLVSFCGTRTSVARASVCQHRRYTAPPEAQVNRTVEELRVKVNAPRLKPEDVERRVIAVVKAFDKVDAAKVTPKSLFSKDLGIDSLDTVELLLDLEDEFVIEIPDVEAQRITSCVEAIEYITAHPYAK